MAAKKSDKKFETIATEEVTCYKCEGTFISKRVIQRCPYCNTANRQEWVEEALELQEDLTMDCVGIILELMESRLDYVKKLKDMTIVIPALDNIVGIKKLCAQWEERPERFLQDLIALYQLRDAKAFQNKAQLSGDIN